MDLKPGLFRGLLLQGYTSPSRVQQLALVPIIRGRDVLVQDQSGVGKTTMISMAVNQIVDMNRPSVQALVLSPTRELARQTADTICQLGERYLGTRCYTCVGGSSLSLQNSPQAHASRMPVISGTPGRVLELIRRADVLIAKHLRILVLDEVDEMVSIGLREQVFEICRFLPEPVQTVLMSATLSESDIPDIVERVTKNPVRIVAEFERSLQKLPIQQYFVHVEEEKWKLDAICDIYNRILTCSQSIIFVNEREKVEWMARKLQERGFAVAAIHGEMLRKRRDRIIEEFRKGAVRILLSTDVIGRGVDVPSINLVVNCDLPLRAESYVHRIGRCSRYGRKGVAVTLVADKELPRLREIEKELCIDLRLLPPQL